MQTQESNLKKRAYETCRAPCLSAAASDVLPSVNLTVAPKQAKQANMARVRPSQKLVEEHPAAAMAMFLLAKAFLFERQIKPPLEMAFFAVLIRRYRQCKEDQKKSSAVSDAFKDVEEHVRKKVDGTAIAAFIATLAEVSVRSTKSRELIAAKLLCECVRHVESIYTLRPIDEKGCKTDENQVEADAHANLDLVRPPLAPTTQPSVSVGRDP
jgi:hypothetical protein